MSDQIWSRQFYKALEAVGKLTEFEKIRLANILVAVSDVKKGQTHFEYEIPPPPKPPETRNLKGVGLIPKKPYYPEKVEIKP